MKLTRTLDVHKKVDVIEKAWGSEKIVTNTDKYCVKLLSVAAYQGCSMHYHVNKTETFYIIEGELKVEFIDPDTGLCKYTMLNRGDAITILPGQAHRFTALSMCAEFLEASTYDESTDSYRVCASNLGEADWRYGSTLVKLL